MEKKIFLIAFIALAVSFFALTNNKEETTEVIETKKEIKEERVMKIEEKSERVVAVEINEKKELPQGEEYPELEIEEAMIEGALAHFEEWKKIPGARQLVEDVINHLQENPNAITYDNFEGEGAIEMKEDFMEKMIPDAEFRAKWIKLMTVIAENATTR